MGKVAFGDSWKEPSWWTKPSEGQKLTQEEAQRVTEEDMAESRKILREAILGMVKNGIGIWNGPVVFYDENGKFSPATLDKATSMAKSLNIKGPFSAYVWPDTPWTCTLCGHIQPTSKTKCQGCGKEELAPEK